jgi:hypothetical protein
MQVVNLPLGQVKKSLAGAVSLNHNGDKGALLAMIHIQDADRGYSTAVNFINPGGKPPSGMERVFGSAASTMTRSGP